MIKNYFTIAIRNLLKQKGLSFINIFGLSVGLAAFILFMIYALNEFSFDSFHKKGNLIYRAYLDIEAREGEKKYYSTYHPMPLGPALKKDLPGVKAFVRLKGAWTESFLKMGDKISREKLSFADPSFFMVFSFPLKEGNAATALNDLNSIVITEKTAVKLFGKEEAVGKVIQVKYNETYVPFKVTGVAENIPSNSGISFSAALVTATCINASAFCSGGRLRASTSSMCDAQISRFARTAMFERNGLVVTPMAPRSRPSASSAVSAESCHHLVGVSWMTQSR